MKKLLCVFLVMALVILPVGGSMVAYAEDAETSSGAATVSEDTTEAEIVYSGTSGTCEWTIDSDGLMTISPADGEETGTLLQLDKLCESSDVPWYKYRKSVTRVVIEEGITYRSAGSSRSVH